MRREHKRAVAFIALLLGLSLAGMSALSWADDSAGDARSGNRASSPPTPAPRTQEQLQLLRLPDRPSPGIGSGRHVQRVKPGRPVALVLPSIGVTAPVYPIGIDGTQTLTPPSDYTTLGWWAQGAQPGDGTGTTIITGHTVHTGGGALDNLGNIHAGDTVVIDRPHQDLRYQVTSVTTYRKGSLATRAAQVFRQDGPERLAIVTCSDYNGTIYLSNTVVIATHPIPVTPR